MGMINWPDSVYRYLAFSARGGIEAINAHFKRECLSSIVSLSGSVDWSNAKCDKAIPRFLVGRERYPNGVSRSENFCA